MNSINEILKRNCYCFCVQCKCCLLRFIRTNLNQLSINNFDIKSMKIIIIAVLLISCFAFLVKICFDNNYYICLISQWQINLGIICSFTCGVCVGKCFCCFIVKKCQISRNHKSRIKKN